MTLRLSSAENVRGKMVQGYSAIRQTSFFISRNLMEFIEARDEVNSYQLVAQPTIARNAIITIPMISFSTNGGSCTHFLCGAERENEEMHEDSEVGRRPAAER